MKKVKITYWISTGLISFMMLASAVMYLSSPDIKAGFLHLGFPPYFRIELAFAKLLGIIVLLLPAIKGRLKEWAYFGFFITFISAFLAHINAGDPAGKWISPLVAIVLLSISYISYNKLAGADLKKITFG